ncbi:MAG TPA: hypothetical protein PLQ76_09420, partial [bacterium]|nr:hypothetical protein [bacterium]
EKAVSAASSIDDEPETFNTLSPRFYQASAIGNVINIKLYLDRIITPPASMSMNIITSELPLTPTTADIPAIDYFIQPKVTLATTTGSYTDNSLNPLSTSHTVTDEQQKSADIVSWTYEIYER